jgi:hypothetical protein
LKRKFSFPHFRENLFSFSQKIKMNIYGNSENFYFEFFVQNIALLGKSLMKF